MQSLATVLAEQNADALRPLEGVLRNVRSWHAKYGFRRLDPAQVNRFLSWQISAMPQVHMLNIADKWGQRRFSSEADPAKVIDVSQRDYFRELLLRPRQQPLIGKSIISLADAKPTFVMAVRLEDQRQQFSGIAYILVDPLYFQTFYARVQTGEGTAVQLLDSTGNTLVSFTDVGADSPPEEAAPVRLTAEQSAPSSSLRVRVSRMQSQVLAPWRCASLQSALRTMVLAFLTVCMAIGLQRQMKRRKQSETRLEFNEQLWKGVFESAKVGIALIGQDGHYLAANPAYQRMLGRSWEHLNERTIEAFLLDEDRALVQSSLKCLRSRQCDTANEQAQYLRPDGSICLAEHSIVRMATDQRTDDMLLVCTEDISERHAQQQQRLRLEARLQHARKLEALGTFASGVAHDFNNLLAAILGYSEQAYNMLATQPLAQQHLQQVLQASQRARELVASLITFSRTRPQAMTTPVALLPLLEEALRMIEVQRASVIVVTLDVPFAQACTLGSAPALLQVMMNLSSNALQAIEGRGTLKITLTDVQFYEPVLLSHGVLEAKSYCCVTFVDSGSGMTTEVMEHLFDPFFTTKPVGQGTGLGLSVVDSIVRDHQGALNVQSEVEKGTCIELYLPATDLRVAVQEEPAVLEVDGAGRGQVVLLLDDEPALVVLNEEILARLGYEPVGFQTPQKAWQAFMAQPERFDVIITDQNMAPESGLQLAARIREVRPDITIILYSGACDQSLRKRAQQIGVSAILQKPLLEVELANALRVALEPQR
ncbi:hypothetical protein AFK24_11205 [Pseudomonas syringae]|uniref:histidine kinase n=2 Tax=Pseudomonas syringae TaxID=317 RepID=A0A1C7Z7M5_PSESX|nr:hypothetical protein AFK24_11205 [Pseudomonas syringae]